MKREQWMGLPLARGTLVTAVGNGAWYASWALYLTGPVGLSAGVAGMAMSVAGGAGVIAAAPAGRLADRFGAREVLTALIVVQGLGTAAFLAVGGVASLVVVACVTTAASASATGVRRALVTRLVAGGDRLAALAALRVVSHVGWAVGAVIGAVVIEIGSAAAFDAVIVLNAVTFLGYAIGVARLPRVAVSIEGRALPVLHDVPYVTLAGICGVLALCWAMLSSALPIWVAAQTHAPRAVAGFVILVSCVGIAVFQVPVTRMARSPFDAARAAVGAAACLALACGLFAAASGPSAPVAAGLIVAGGIAHLAGELLFVAASWGLSVPLMRDDVAGQYQGVFATGEAAAQLAGPALMTSVVVTGIGGWAVLAGLFVAAGVPAPAVTRRASAERASG